MKKVRILIILIIAHLSTYGFGQALQTKLKAILETYANSGSLTAGTSSKQADLRAGSVSIPADFSHTRTGTLDSDKGEITNGDLKIDYDIGRMAGTHMNEFLRPNTSFYSEKKYNGITTIIGLQKKGLADELVITFYGEDMRNLRFPANFWAVVKDESDIKIVLDIVFSYQVRKETK